MDDNYCILTVLHAYAFPIVSTMVGSYTGLHNIYSYIIVYVLALIHIDCTFLVIAMFTE